MVSGGGGMWHGWAWSWVVGVVVETTSWEVISGCSTGSLALLDTIGSDKGTGNLQATCKATN